MDKIKLFYYNIYILNYSSFYSVVFGSVCNKKVIRFSMAKYALVLTRKYCAPKVAQYMSASELSIFRHTHLITYNYMYFKCNNISCLAIADQKLQLSR